MTTGSLRKQLRSLHNAELLREIGRGESAFRPGIFPIYVREAASRGLTLDPAIVAGADPLVRQRSEYETARILVGLGVGLLIVGGGIFSFIPGLLLQKKERDGHYRFEERFRGYGKFFIGWPIGLVTLLVVIFLILRFSNHW